MKVFFAAALLAGALTGSGAAQAMPLAPLGAAGTAAVLQVAQGCGPEAHRNRFGECRPDFRGPPPRYGYAPRPRYEEMPRVMRRPPPMMVRCPPGMFASRDGRCRPGY